jgi:hypothetical protein
MGSYRHRDRRPVSFRPRLDRLEDRNLLSVSITQHGDVLVIRGDFHEDTITINDNGTGAAHNITVVANGTTFTSGTDPVDKIFVSTRGFADHVFYNLTGDTKSAMTLGVRLGQGHDDFTAHLNGHQLLKGADYAFDVHGGNGGDTSQFFSDDNVGIAEGATLSVRMHGGFGEDHFGVSYKGVLNGTFDMALDGGAGNDRLNADFELQAGSNGMLGTPTDPAILRGGPGDDVLNYLVHVNGTAGVFATADGGSGIDLCRHTANVKVVNCEINHEVP